MKDSYDRPRRREQGLLLEELDDELVVCDTSAGSAHVLGAAAADVWRACDGRRDLKELQSACGLDRATVIAALDGLRDCGLLLEGPHDSDVTLSRRGMLSKSAAIGAGIGLGAPLIRSITLPSPAAAASGGPGSTPAPTTTGAPFSTPAPTTTSLPTTRAPTTTTRGTTVAPPMTTTRAP